MEARPRVGLFAGIFDKEGKLLVKRRLADVSLPGEWDLPGGAVEEENNAKALDERIIGEELAREVREEIGIEITLPQMPEMFPAVLKGGGDWAFVIPVGVFKGLIKKLGEVRFVSPNELKELAEGPPGNRLVNGWGKRMSRLALKALVYSPNGKYREQAGLYLAEIHLKWLAESQSS